MKTERRHELQNNELAAWLTVWIERIQPYLKTIFGVMILGLVIILGFTIVKNREQQAAAQAWSAYFDAHDTRNAEDFVDVSQEFPQSSPGMWAMQSAGDIDLTNGAIQLFRDRDAGRDEIQNAAESYEKIATTTNDPMLKPRALFGWGQALEAIGELQAAQEKYTQVVTGAEKGGEFEGSVVAQLASHRLEALKQPATQTWYSWFAEQKPIQSPLSNQGLFDNLPALPDEPDINLPQPGELIPGTLPEEESSTDTSESGDGPILFNPADTTNPSPESTDSSPEEQETTLDTEAVDDPEAVIDTEEVIETEAVDPEEASEPEAPSESDAPSTDSE